MWLTDVKSATPFAKADVVNAYSRFKVLLDDPAEVPGLRFGDYATALAEIIAGSRAEFAVGIFGIFGTWGTELMCCSSAFLGSSP